MKPLYTYLNFRELLRDFYTCQKQTRRGYSYRKFALDAGFTSPVFIKLVIDGKTNLSAKSALQLARAMALTDEQCTFFCTLVSFNQAKNFTEKEKWLLELRSIAEKVDTHILSSDHYDYYSAWYISAVREIAARMPFASVEQLSSMLTPPVGVRQVKKALALLQSIGLLRKDNSGAWQQTSQNVSTGDEVRSLAVRNHHKQMAGLAVNALDEVAVDERDISGLTMGVSREVFDKIKAEISEARRRITQIVNQDSASDRIYRLNLQLFPLSKKMQLRNTGLENSGGDDVRK